MSVELVQDQVESSSAQADSAATQLQSIDLATAVDPVSDAMPGGQTARAADALAEAWRQRVANLSTDIADYAAALQSSARLLGGTDTGAAEELGRTRPQDRV